MPRIAWKLKDGLVATLIPLNTLLVFFLVFSDRIRIPAWLQVAGRMHPLMLHFPIVLLILFFLLSVFGFGMIKRGSQLSLAVEILLLLSALTAVITALMGLFLSKEPGYDLDALFWHKWGGVALALLLSVLYWTRSFFLYKRGALLAAGTFSFLLLLLSAHQGAGITHGQNFLLAPILPEKKIERVPLDQAVLYTHLVKPILDEKCSGCHNRRKAKGGLVMESPELLLKGGKDGALWDTMAPDLGLMMHRLHLPLDQKKHMPPHGKPQLTPEEEAILYQWIRKGAPFELMAKELDPSDTLFQLAAERLSQQEGDSYDFAAADENLIGKLNNGDRVVYPVAMESPALNVDFYNRDHYNSESLKELSAVGQQLVEINLAHMPVRDVDIPILASFKNLRRLNLNFTNITGANLGELKALPHLEELSIAGTAVKATQLAQLQDFPELKRAFVWHIAVSEDGLEKLKNQAGKIRFDTGFRGDTLLMKLTPPILQNEETLLTEATPLRLKHYIQGTVIRYTLDGSLPDSLNSPVYDGKLVLDHNVTLKARAFKAGWIGSDVLTSFFFKSTFVPDSIALLQMPDPKYKGRGARTLIDREKGGLNFANGKWLGYREHPAEMELFFKEPVKASNITISVLENTGQYIMPPAQVQVWGSADGKPLRFLGETRPTPASKDDLPAIIPVQVDFAPTLVGRVRVVVKNLQSLPDWHPGKGEKGWVFMDEVMVN